MTDTVKMLSDDEVAEIEARANAATPRYCVDWEKGRHALLQDSGWRSASEEQPRTIATFDRENGYLDLLFCAEARTDIPALCATVRALRAENERLSRDSAELARKLENSGRNASLMSQQINAARERSPEYDHRDRS